MSLDAGTTTGTSAPVAWPADFPGTWEGVSPVPLLDALARGWDGRPEDVPLVFDDGRSYTNREIKTHVELLASYLRPRLEAGQKVALAMGNRLEFVVAYLAVLANRAVVVSLSPEVGSHEAEYAVNDSNCVLAITDESSTPTFNAVLAKGSALREVISVTGEEPNGLAYLYAGLDPLDLSNVGAHLDDLIDIGYTSGTTGLPKALGGTHREVLRYIDVGIRTRPRDSGNDHRVLYPLQFHYGDPLTALFTAIHGGFTVIVMRKFSASRFWAVAKEFKATEIVTIGSIPEMLLSRVENPADREHSIRGALALAIPRNRHAELQRRFGFPWREAYGSSESGPAIAMPPGHAPHYVGTGAIGIPYPDVDARLVDLDGNLVEGSGSGELELSGHVVFEGYVNDPDASAEAMHDGWLRTGDILRRDENGVYYFEGRRKELIRRSGVNIAPAEVEAVLRLHPDVLDVAVVPVADETMGEEIKAYVELTPGAPFRPAALADFAAKHLARQKIPRYLEHRLEPFPRTPTQRIPKNQLKVDGMHRTDTAWDRTTSGE